MTCSPATAPRRGSPSRKNVTRRIHPPYKVIVGQSASRFVFHTNLALSCQGELFFQLLRFPSQNPLKGEYGMQRKIPRLLYTFAAASALSLLLGSSSFAYDWDNNPPGPWGGPGTNWENPPGAHGGPGASSNQWWRRGNPPGPVGG